MFGFKNKNVFVKKAARSHDPNTNESDAPLSRANERGTSYMPWRDGQFLPRRHLVECG